MRNNLLEKKIIALLNVSGSDTFNSNYNGEYAFSADEVAAALDGQDCAYCLMALYREEAIKMDIDSNNVERFIHLDCYDEHMFLIDKPIPLKPLRIVRRKEVEQ